MAELLARLRATLRRVSNFEERDPVFDAGWFSVDLANHVATVGEPRRPVSLTRIEWAIVDHLVRHVGRLATYRDLIDAVWGPESNVQPHLLRVHLGSIRHKLERDPSRPEHFITDTNVGVRFLPGSELGERR
jgi:two-component system KDP operon response regulator KdpE